MSKKVEFYTIAFYSEERIVDCSVKNFLEKIEQMIHNREGKLVRNIEGHYIRLFSFYRPQPSQNKMVVPFGKLKSKDKPYWINEETDQLEEFKRDLFDLNSMAYDSRNQIMMLTTNREGPKAGVIENYLNSFIPEDLGIKLKIEEIIYNTGIENVRNANYVRNITINLDLGASLNRFYLNQFDTEEHNLIKALKLLATTAKDEGAGRSLTLNLGVGNGEKEASLNLETMLQLLEEININEDIIKEITVRYKNNSEEKVDIARLKNNSVKLCYNCQGKGNQISPEELMKNMDSAIENKRLKFAPVVRKRLHPENIIEIEEFDILKE